MNKKALKILGIISVPFMYLIFFGAIKYLSFVHFSYDLLFFATIGIAYVSLHFFLDIRKMYDWIFRFRYLIGAIIFAMLVAGGYQGSSLSFWNNYVNPEIEVKDSMPVIGIARGIRSDQWMVSMPTNLSQFSENVNFNSNNDLMNAKDNNVTLYPRLIVKDISMLMYPNSWGFLFLPKENAFSFYWYFNYFVAFFVAIELFMIITKKNRLYSVLGAFLAVIAPAVLWWDNCLFILYGGAALLTIYNFIKNKNIVARLMLSVLLGYIATCYILIMYPAWMIPYAYLFVMIFIWMLIDNKKDIKWKDLLYLIPTAITCAITFFPLYFGAKDVFEIVSNTVYPGNRVWYGGGNWKLLYTYISQMFYPYISIGNPCEYSQYISLFPIPLFMGMYYLIKNKLKNKKIDWFLLLTAIFSILMTIWCSFRLPEFISNITFMKLATGDRAQLSISLASIFMFIYIISRYESDKKEKILSIDNVIKFLIATLITAVVLWISVTAINAAFPNCIRAKMNLVSVVVFVPIFYFLIKNTKKTNFILTLMLIFVTAVSSFLIMPITKGLSIIFEKPFAKEIQSLVKENKEAKFLAVEDGAILSNYILANGAKTISSTNFVPNLDLWHKFDFERRKEDIYNRYAHIFVHLVDNNTSFELIQTDIIRLNLYYPDICKTGANYLVSKNKLEEQDEFYSLIYNEGDIYIYKTTCE